MKVLLTALNAKYVHTSLASWYLYQFCRQDYPELKFVEFNINQELSWVCGEIYAEQADAIGFSCNIWNIEETLIICRRLKAISPGLTIILGGPEVWVEPEKMLQDNPCIDFIVIGEGEITFKEWLAQYHSSQPAWYQVNGLVYRYQDGIIHNPPREPIKDLAVLPFPYPADLSDFRQKLVYYESSRGCPNHCQYCLSANERGVRFLPLERVKEELLRFIKAEVFQVKLVDRTFNCNPARAKEIWRFLIDHPGKTNFHFEIAGDLIDDETIAILKEAPLGLFQFEIGVQSTNQETLDLISRRMDLNKLLKQVSRLINETRVFIHLDLIAGLPAEGYHTFANSLNELFAIEPHRIQLGFLKLLKGTGIRERASEYDYVYTCETPYEVMANRWISYAELLKLKIIEDLLERYYNSGRFKLAFKYLIPRFSSAFGLFEELAAWWKSRRYDRFSHKSKDLYAYLLDFCCGNLENINVIRNLLKYDLLSNERLVELPEWAGPLNSNLKEFAYSFWQQPEQREQYPEFSSMATRDILRRVVFAEFDFDPEQVAGNPRLLEPTLSPTVILFIYEGKKVRTVKVQEGAGES